MKALIRRTLPPVLLGLILCLIPLMPQGTDLLPSAANPELPLDYDLPGWYGVKTQESEKERSMLADDTKFSKAIYNHINPFTYEKEEPPVNVSFVYSGSDLNNSIHRPERCLPAQGHLNLSGRDEELTLADGRKLTLRRLSSNTLIDNKAGHNIYHIHYYVFVGSDTVCSSHLVRTWRDIWDRMVTGRVQRWAYIQIGTHWGEEVGITEQQAESHLRALIRDLVPRQIDWNAIKN